MIDQWREWLYPLGFLSAIAFSSRMILQWLKSEASGKSMVTPSFWKLSLIGNVSLAIHAFIQIQFHVCVIQAGSAVISWRNLNLMKPKEQRLPLSSVIKILVIAITLTTLAFFLQGYFVDSISPEDSFEWFRVPTLPWQSATSTDIPLAWHLIGFIGLTLFSSRFWVQWWFAERNQKSYLGATFWWISLIGESICLLYFFMINDPVNFIGPAFAAIPYIRNLMLIYRPRTRKCS